jgi:hypothetical protein
MAARSPKALVKAERCLSIRPMKALLAAAKSMAYKLRSTHLAGPARLATMT